MFVIPAKAGIQGVSESSSSYGIKRFWIPAFAGMTETKLSRVWGSILTTLLRLLAAKLPRNMSLRSIWPREVCWTSKLSRIPASLRRINMWNGLGLAQIGLPKNPISTSRNCEVKPEPYCPAS